MVRINRINEFSVYDVGVSNVPKVNLNGTIDETFKPDEKICNSESYKSPFSNENKNILKNMGVREYTYTPMTATNAIELSQTHLINLLRYYEGHKVDGYYCAKTVENDKFNIETYGFGLRKLAMHAIGKAKNVNGKYVVTNPPKNQDEAFDQLVKYLNDVSKKEVISYLGSELYNKIPKSVKEALLDYHFKNGGKILAKSGLKEALATAVKNNNWETVLKKLVFAKAASNPQGADEPGIYRRSLSRVILAANGLKSLPNVNNKQIDNTVKEIYQKACACAKANNISTKDFDDIYNTYIGKKNDDTSTTQNNDGKTTTYKCLKDKESLYGIAIALRPQGQNKDFTIRIIEELARLNNIKLKGTDNNGYPNPERMISQNDSVIIPNQITFNNKTYKLNTLNAGWEELSNQADDSVDEEYVAPSLFQESIINNTATIDKTSLKNKDLCIVQYDYEVQPKENLYGIAGKLGLDIQTIKKDNNIKDINVIQAGQKLKIKSIGYQIKKGDNLTQIAKKFNTSIDILMAINLIEDQNKINVGQIIQIPAYIHTVQRKESLTQIADNAGVSIDDIVSVNKKTSKDNIKENEILVIPYKNANFGVAETISGTDTSGAEIVEITTDSSIPKLLRKKRKKNGKVLATKEVFKPTNSGKLSGKTIIINAGHGYPADPKGKTDVGTQGRGGLADEWLINYYNAMKLKDKLVAQGAKVIFIQGREGKHSKGEDLISAEIRKEAKKADMFISFHVNSSPKAPTNDRAEIYYPTGSNKSKKLAENFEKKLDNKQNNKEYAMSKGKNYQVLRTAKASTLPAILYEVAFMNHSDGRARMKNSNFMDNNITLLSNSIVEYFTQ